MRDESYLLHIDRASFDSFTSRLDLAHLLLELTRIADNKKLKQMIIVSCHCLVYCFTVFNLLKMPSLGCFSKSYFLSFYNKMYTEGCSLVLNHSINFSIKLYTINYFRDFTWIFIVFTRLEYFSPIKHYGSSLSSLHFYSTSCF